ncbi:hypothetical protein [Streptomyces abikoensis]|uniref:hypothetical protein n=1 Tax=Streptomyces abikoensis TaxID=97398 RepID=UPI001671940F|nr:hypothetical protein [Streptomyces abikoensis]GGP36060.1 hypothetical protein GCM10010214_06070 [Streptomyces abikoensis]
MVDPVSLGAITSAVTAAAGSVGTEAGRQAWGSLVGMVRRAFGRGRAGEDEEGAVALPVDPRDEQQVQSLAALIFGRVYQDAAFAEEFRQWAEEARSATLSVDNSTVNNTFSGGHATNLYQGRDFTIGR